jgi:formylglycine-generating enzyme required for sulfatase activity
VVVVERLGDTSDTSDTADVHGCGDGVCTAPETAESRATDCAIPAGFLRTEPGTFTMGSPEGELARGDD